MPKRNKTALIVGSAVALLVALALVLVLVFMMPRRTAVADFNGAQSAYTQAQADLAAGLTAAQKVATEANTNQLTDSSTLDSLNNEITQAQRITSDVPVMASRTADIKQQTADLRSGTNMITSWVKNLASAVAAVQASQLEWAKNTLTNAISAAQNIYVTYTEVAGAAALSSLQSQIAAAQSLLGSIDKADPATIGATAAQMAQALQAAQKVVTSTASAPPPSACGGILLPPDVDPMVCGGMPAGAVKISPVNSYYATTVIFVMPSNNVACVQNSYGFLAYCEIYNHSWAVPSSLTCHRGDQADSGTYCQDDSLIGLAQNGQVEAYDPSDVPDWGNLTSAGVTIPTLQYGQVANFSPVACLSDTHGVTCWHTDTHHGFKMNVTTLLYW